MLNDLIIKAIDNVSSVKDFQQLKQKWEMSDTADEFKKEAIRELKARKSIYDLSPNFTPESVIEDIKAGVADIDDIN